MQNINELYQRLMNTTLKASEFEKQLDIEIKIIEEEITNFEKTDLGDNQEWYIKQEKYYRKENGKYLEFNENGIEVEAIIKREKQIQFMIQHQGLKSYIGYLSESQILNITNQKIDIFDFFLELEQDVNHNLFKNSRTSIINIIFEDTPNALYKIEINFQYNQIQQIVKQQLFVYCKQVLLTPAELLIKSNEKWSKEFKYLQNQIIEIKNQVNRLQQQVIEQEEQIAQLME